MGDETDETDADGRKYPIDQIKVENIMRICEQSQGCGQPQGSGRDYQAASKTINQPAGQKSTEIVRDGKKGKDAGRGCSCPGKIVDDRNIEN